MGKLPEKVVRYDVVRVEYGKAKMCKCLEPHCEIDYQNQLVYCTDCGAIVDPLEALVKIARDTERWENYIKQLLEQRRQIEGYKPRRIIIKELEKQYVNAERSSLEPTCPRCGRPFGLEELLKAPWVNQEFAKMREAEHEEENPQKEI